LVVLLASGGIPGSGGLGPSDAAAQVKAVGIALFGPYLLGVELASVLLLAGLVAAHRLTAGGDEGPAPAGPEVGQPLSGNSVQLPPSGNGDRP
jgi:NADH-quinone oxidoreductase subunit J